MWRSINLVVMVLMCLASVLHMLWWMPHLPDVVPIHFNGAGEADQTSSRSGLIALFMGINLAIIVLCVGTAYFLKYIPNDLVNLPNKDYWLEPPQRTETLEWVSGMMYFIATITVGMMLGLFHLTGLVALERIDDISPEMFYLVGAYLFLTFAVCGYSFFRFGKSNIPPLELQRLG